MCYTCVNNDKNPADTSILQENSKKLGRIVTPLPPRNSKTVPILILKFFPEFSVNISFHLNLGPMVESNT